MSKNMEGKNIPNANQQNNRMLDSLASHFATAEFDESKHPRDKDGKFGAGGGSSDDQKAAQYHRDLIKKEAIRGPISKDDVENTNRVSDIHTHALTAHLLSLSPAQRVEWAKKEGYSTFTAKDMASHDVVEDFASDHVGNTEDDDAHGNKFNAEQATRLMQYYK